MAVLLLQHIDIVLKLKKDPFYDFTTLSVNDELRVVKLITSRY